ncbi:MAG: Mth938-like domain-containing protein [Betaproteobacteria bacterium]|nr:Mth938-like domain-containing protein [Betaproteobacteria bacterium]
MKLHLAQSAGQNVFSGYGTDYVAVNDVRYEKSVVVTPREITEWNVRGFEALTEADFAFVAGLGAEIVIFGTGGSQRFPRPELVRALVVAGVGLEVMDSRAACRTYNILAAEGRKVVAAILVD